MNSTGVYLYGFIPRILDLSGIEGIAGIDGDGPIRALNLEGSAAVVGMIGVDAFEAAMSAGVDGGPDPAWVLPRALRHEAILEAVQTRSPVLPARFGTLFSSSEALQGLASEHQQTITRFFDELGDRLEWSLRGYYDPDHSVELVLESDHELSRCWRSLPESPGTRYFLEKKLREEARRLARQTAARAAFEVCQALRTLTPDVRSLPLRGGEGPGREMILHETFLLSPKVAAETLEQLENAASEAVKGLLTLEPSGPWPAFHFCPELGGRST